MARSRKLNCCIYNFPIFSLGEKMIGTSDDSDLHTAATRHSVTPLTDSWLSSLYLFAQSSPLSSLFHSILALLYSQLSVVVSFNQYIVQRVRVINIWKKGKATYFNLVLFALMWYILELRLHIQNQAKRWYIWFKNNGNNQICLAAKSVKTSNFNMEKHTSSGLAKCNPKKYLQYFPLMWLL